MLFRRGANAIASGRFDFAKAAADAMEEGGRRSFNAITLRMLADLSNKVPPFASIYSRAYRFVEGRIVRSRAHLQDHYGDLLRPMPED
jgi:hypothetical protein